MLSEDTKIRNINLFHHSCFIHPRLQNVIHLAASLHDIEQLCAMCQHHFSPRNLGGKADPRQVDKHQ